MESCLTMITWHQEIAGSIPVSVNILSLFFEFQPLSGAASSSTVYSGLVPDAPKKTQQATPELFCDEAGHGEALTL